jgi:hypothetical protein
MSVVTLVLGVSVVVSLSKGSTVSIGINMSNREFSAEWVGEASMGRFAWRRRALSVNVEIAYGITELWSGNGGFLSHGRK